MGDAAATDESLGHPAIVPRDEIPRDRLPTASGGRAFTLLPASTRAPGTRDEASPGRVPTNPFTPQSNLGPEGPKFDCWNPQDEFPTPLFGSRSLF